jgi:hypothetical protein
MKVFTLGSAGRASVAVCEILGANTQRRQVTVLAFARSKAEAFGLLAARGMAPGTVRDQHFRGATGDLPALLESVGLGDAPAVYAVHNAGTGTVVRVEPDGSATVVGEVERPKWDPSATAGPRLPLAFVPTPAGVAGSVFTEPMALDDFVRMMELRTRGDVHRVAEACHEALLGITDDPAKWDGDGGRILPAAIPALIIEAEAHLEQEELSADDFAAACLANVELVKRLTEQLADARGQRQALARTAVQRDMVSVAAKAFDVSAPRIYQLSDEFLVKQSSDRRERLTRNQARFRPVGAA